VRFNASFPPLTLKSAVGALRLASGGRGTNPLELHQVGSCCGRASKKPTANSTFKMADISKDALRKEIAGKWTGRDEGVVRGGETGRAGRGEK